VQEEVKWPAGWPGSSEEEKIDYLKSLYHFKASLIKDGYSVDFQKDFASHYASSQFFDVPTWFNAPSGGKLADYFSDPQSLKFKDKYGSNTTLPGPGIYDVYIIIEFGSVDWGLYSANKPKGEITVEFYKMSDPPINSVFYYLPFDGEVGIESDNGRQNYGLNYLNGGNPVRIVENPRTIETTHSPGSSALMNMSTERKSDLRFLNGDAGSRGTLLSIEVQGTEPFLLFAPSYATPIILKIENEQSATESDAKFSIQESQQALNVGSNLTYWTGLGECADFSGAPIRDVFDFTADERSGDKEYKLSWNSVDLGGKEYVYSIIFTPPDKSYLVSADSVNAKFLSPDSGEAQNVQLKGIQGMQFNVRGGQKIDDVARVLELIESGHVCVTNSGQKSSFWWNPKKLKDTKGSQLSVTEFEQSLQPGRTCIGSE